MLLRAFLPVLTLCAATAAAQWIQYPSSGIPRTKDGKPDLSAPAPRTSDGKPDLSGVWDIEHNRPCPPEGCNDMLIGQEFMNIGWSLKGGLPYQPWARDLVKARQALNGRDDPLTQCLPGGTVRMLTTPLMKKIVQMPGLVIILSERNAMYRQIFTDGRPLPRDPQPSWNGYSTAKWEGGALVVRTNGFRDGIWLDRSGSPMSEGATTIERYRRLNFGRLEIELTVNDPKTYTAPWTVKMNQFLVPDTDLLDYVCMDNEQDRKHFAGGHP
jgi:hypothetical protein